MSPGELFDHAAAAGIALSLEPDGGGLHYKLAPGADLTPDRRALLLANKGRILDLLHFRDWLLQVGDTIGVPARVVLGLPMRDVEGTREQLPLWTDPLARARVLHWYLRELADAARTEV